MNSIDFDSNTFNISIGLVREKQTTRNKGKSLLQLPEHYCMVDIETTGLSPDYCEIIEIGALKVVGNEIVDSFQTLVKPIEPIDDFIEELTGISNDMVKDAPSIGKVLPQFLDFVGNSVILGYNVNFDINFLYDCIKKCLNIDFQNDYVDLLRIARRTHPELHSHKLKIMLEMYGIINEQEHRALGDCHATNTLYYAFQDTILQNHESLEEFIKKCNTNKHTGIDIHSIVGDPSKVCVESPFYQKNCVFTGKLEHMTRKEAMQVVVDIGGIVGNGVTKSTNFLILGDLDFVSNIKNGKTTKMLKAEKLMLQGQDISIIPESVFYDMIHFE